MEGEKKAVWMKYIPIKLCQRFQEKWTLKEKWAVMWHILTIEMGAQNLEGGKKKPPAFWGH